MFEAKGKQIPIHFHPHIQSIIPSKVMHSKKFNDYLTKIRNPEEGVQVTKIEIVGVDMFSGGKIGFISLKAHTQKDGFSLPNFVFPRGELAAVLLFVNNKLAGVEQYRVPVQQTLIEAPTGMLDEDGDFVSKAAVKIEEEMGLK